MDINENILNIIRILKTKPSMILVEHKTYCNYSVYMQGYFDLLQILTGIKFDRELSLWYSKKHRFKKSNLFWFSEFESLNKHLVESEKIDLFLNVIEEFVLEKNFKFEKLIQNHFSL